MRALFGALVGLIAGAIVVAGIGVGLGSNAFWSVLIAGLLAGILMRLIASGSGSIYAKGGLAALATALAAVSGPLVATEWFRAERAGLEKSRPVAVANQSDDREEATDVTASGDSQPVEPVPTASRAGRAGGISPPSQNPFAATDIVFMAIGCLIAYQVGKGTPAAARTTEEPGEPVEPEDDQLVAENRVDQLDQPEPATSELPPRESH